MSITKDTKIVYFEPSQVNKIKTTLNLYNEDLIFANTENGFIIVTVKRFGYLTEIFGFDDSYSSFRSFSSKKACSPATSYVSIRKGATLNIEEEDDDN